MAAEDKQRYCSQIAEIIGFARILDLKIDFRIAC
jgi:hypothetical protein